MPEDDLFIRIEFLGGPQDGKVISADVPSFAGGAPRVISIQENGEKHQYRAPDGDVEVAEAETSFGVDEPVKYRYTGRTQT